MLGLEELEAQLSASVLKSKRERTKPKVSEDVMKPPESRAVQLLKKYKVRQNRKYRCSLKWIYVAQVQCNIYYYWSSFE